MWTVYRHIAPNGKMYIGITSKEPEHRWGKDGKGYPIKYHFGKAIKKYGWNNIKHEILYENLEEEQAKCMEMSLIRYYKTSNPQFGYNMTAGGNGCIPNEETKQRIINIHKGAKRSTDAKQHMSESQTGKQHTDECKLHQKISATYAWNFGKRMKPIIMIDYN